MTKKTTKKTHKKPTKNYIVAVLWQSAMYSFEDTLPDFLPLPTLSTGFIYKTNDRFFNLVTKVIYDKKTRRLGSKNGFLIPWGAVIDIKEIGYYEK